MVALEQRQTVSPVGDLLSGPMFSFATSEGTAHTSISVLVADASGPWRDFVRVTLAPLPGVRLLDVVSNGIDAIEKSHKLKPDVLLLDLQLPGLSGLETVRRIRDLRLITKALIVSLVADYDVVRAALQQGVSAYIHKLDFGTEVLAAMQASLQDKVYLSNEIRRINVSSSSPKH